MYYMYIYIYTVLDTSKREHDFQAKRMQDLDDALLLS